MPDAPDHIREAFVLLDQPILRDPPPLDPKD